MFKVKNSKVIGKISRRSLKNSRSRNTIAIAAIILTAVMFTTVFTIGASVIKSFQLSTMRQVGTTSHGGFKFLTWQQYEKVAADTAVKDISYDIIVGFGENSELNKTTTEIRCAEEKAAEWSFNSPTTGTLPQNRLDIATTTAVLDALGVPHELGAKVLLEFTSNGVKHYETFTLCGWWESDIVTGVNEAFVSREYAEDVAPVWQEGQEYYDYTNYSGSVNPSLYFASSWNLEKQMAELKSRCGFGADVNEGVNWAYAADAVDASTLAFIAGLLALITLSGYLIIYNIFYISVNGEIRFYGLLKTIGTTSKQLKRIVRRQALLLSIVGIPLGLAAGFALSTALVPAVMTLVDVTDCEISANPLIFAGSGIFTLITVWISCIKPCRLVCKISPVEAVRYNADISAKRKTKRTKKVTPFSMAVGNIGRTKKKTIAVALSLTLSLVLLNTTVTLTRGFDMDKYLRNKLVSDFVVTDSTVLNGYSAVRMFNSITPEVQEHLKNLDGVTESGCVYMCEYYHMLSNTEKERAQKILDECAGEVAASMTLQQAEKYLSEGYMISHIYGADGIAEDNLEITEGGFDREKFESGNYVIASAIFHGGEDKFYEVGEKVTLDAGNGAKEYEVMALGSIPYALGPGHSHGFDVYFTLPSAEFASLTGESGAMNIALNAKPDKTAAVDEQIKSYCERINTTLDYRSKQIYIDEFKDTQRTYALVGGLLSFILALIGILNFINAAATSIQSRRRELAVLQSIGMTGRQLRRMLIGEGACYIILTALLALTLGSALTYGLMRAVENIMWYFSYHFTIMPVLLSILVLLVLAAAIPVICLRAMCGKSIVERLGKTD